MLSLPEVSGVANHALRVCGCNPEMDVTIQMKTIEQYLAVVLFIMLYKMAPTFESVNEILKWNHVFATNESYWAVLID